MNDTSPNTPTILSECVRTVVQRYFDDLEEQTPQNMHQMVLTEVERPMLQVVMQQTDGNQTKASQILGMNRSTLRKKLIQYGLSD